MRRVLALLGALALVAAACGDSEEDTTPPTSAGTAVTAAPTPDPPATDPPAAGTSADIAITEVVFGDHVTVTNVGSGTVNISGFWVCNRPSYTPLPEQSLAPGESVQIDASSLGGLSEGGGEAALYISNSFGDSAAIVDYVAWGSGGGRGSVAAEAGIWPDGDVVSPGGATITAPGGGSSAADWSG